MPSFPTASIASAINLPISVSLFAEMEAICAISSLLLIDLENSWILSMIIFVAFSKPRLRYIGLTPEVTCFIPSSIIAWAKRDAVVVPSPAISWVFSATSLQSWAPIFSNSSSNSISFAIVTPSLVIRGEPNFLSKTTFLPLGPRVILTASASWSTPLFKAVRASCPYNICFAIFFIPPYYHILLN